MTRVIVLAIAAMAAMLLLVWATQRHMIYLPSREVLPPSTVGLAGVEAVTFATDDGVTLQGWFVPPSGTATGDAVIVFNGNAGNRSYRADLARGLAVRGVAVLLFDYRGFGDSPGSPSEEGLARDARAARAFVESRPGVNAARISYFGESLGSGVAVRLALERPPRALILRSPFTSLVDLGRHHYGFLPVRWLLRDRFPSIDRIPRVTVPVLIIAAAHDSIVPTEQSRQLFAAAREPKRLVIVNGADHNDDALAGGGAVMLDAVAAFLRDAGPGS